MAEMWIRATGEHGPFRAYPIVRKASSPNGLAIGTIYHKRGDDLNKEEQALVYEYAAQTSHDVILK